MMENNLETTKPENDAVSFDFKRALRATSLEEAIGETPEEDSEKPIKEVMREPKKILKKEEPTDEESDDDLEEKAEVAAKPNEEKKKEQVDWKAQVEKLEKNNKETRKWGEEVNKKALIANKRADLCRQKISEYVESAVLNEEEAGELLEYLSIQDIPELTIDSNSLPKKVAKIWDTEIESIRKYGNYENLDGHINALWHRLDEATLEERREMFKDLMDLVDDEPIEFIKEVLKLGKEHYEDIYEEYSNVGNLKSFKNLYEEKINTLQKTIDKQEKEIVKLKKRYEEDYDEKPKYRIQDSGVGGKLDSSNLNDLGQMFKAMHSGKYRPTFE